MCDSRLSHLHGSVPKQRKRDNPTEVDAAPGADAMSLAF